MKTFIITWDEKKFGSCYRYFSVIEAANKKDAQQIYFDEQNLRRRKELPHMFHVKIGMSLDTTGRTMLLPLDFSHKKATR